MPEKGFKIWPFSKMLTYFQKVPSEMNSTHPFYPILIPNNPYMWNFYLTSFCLYGDTSGFQKYSCTGCPIEKGPFSIGCPKSSLREVKLIFWIFFRGASATKSWEKSRIFRNGLPDNIFSKGQITIPIYWGSYKK